MYKHSFMYNWRARDLGQFRRYGNMRDKDASVDLYTWTTLNKLQSMFKYEGLPDTIPQRDLELYLMVNGSCIITDVNGDLYALVGGFGGHPNAYYHPTHYIVANPYLKLNKEYVLNENAILLKNDHLMLGLMPLIMHYAHLLAENDLTIFLATINQRIQNIITAGDDIQKQGADKFFSDLENGKLGAVVTSDFFEGIKSNPLNSPSGNAISQLIELQQYLRAGLLNDIGISADWSTKKETTHNAEVSQSSQSLLPLIDEMLLQRQEATEKVNEMFGTNITVQLASAWEEQREEMELAKELDEAQIESLENGSQEGTNPEETGKEGGESDEQKSND